MTRSNRRFIADQRGASAVEFALVVVPFLFLIVGVVEVGRAFWTRQVLTDVAMAGARCMGVLQVQCTEGGNYSATKTRNFIEDLLRSRGVMLPGDGIAMTPDTSCEGLPGFSMVTIAAPFVSALPLDKVLDLDGTACFPNQPKDG